jgi:hypothetical protein
MPIGANRFRTLTSELASDARSHGTDVDKTFAIELRNYSRHVGVRDLPEQDLADVLTEIGSLASKKGAVLDGAIVRSIIEDICIDGPWSTCASAAYKVLRAKHRDAAAERLKAIVDAALAKVKING